MMYAQLFNFFSISSNSRSSFYDLYMSSDEEDVVEDDKDFENDDANSVENGSRADDSIIEDTSSHDIWQGKY